MNTEERCANCEELILGQPVYFDGGVFCCAGCTAGGPCVCTYAAAPANQAPPAIATSEAGRQPLAFPARDGNVRVIVLRLGGFRDQHDLLEFALALENVGVLAEVSLTRAEPADAWFAVHAASAQQVLAALQEVRGWLISANASEAYVEGRIENMLANAIGGEPEPVLPQRPRFRVFSPRPEASSIPAPVMAATAAAPPGAAADQPETVSVPAHAAPPRTTSSLPQPPERSPQPLAPVLPTAVAPIAPAEPAPAAAAQLAGPRLISGDPVDFHQPDMIAADDRPGGAVPLVEHLTLVVYPFHSFVALNEFQGAIRVLRGVTNTRVRRFYRGTLHLAVDYEDVIPLAERLQDLRGFRWQMVSESRQEIELLLEDTGSLMAAEGDG